MALLRYPSKINNKDLHPAIIQFQFIKRNSIDKTEFDDTVQLYMPEQASAPSTISYDSESFGLLGKAAANAFKQGATAEDVKGTLSGLIDKVKHQAIFETGASLVNKASSFIGDSNISGRGLGGEIAGKVANPYLTVVFRGVDFRNFNFTFKFIPLNQEECDTVSDIIRTFRKHALPSYADEGAFLNYPSNCSIAYFWKGDVNKYLPRFKMAVCTGVDVDFTSSGTFATFRNGMPTHITMNTSWKEIEIVTRQDVEEYGY